ncbi:MULTISPECIES: hypothetical protein [Anaeromyxobacter]|uniref:hypothetical protein n=1 Tax=Anaeromyxobacter TaxID=161492 RepID=UPI001F590373|nr:MULTISPECIES: hypothetical protein [unclassified Anaeromyxobacter]
MRYRIRHRSNGITEIRRRTVADALLSRELAGLALLLGVWAICTVVLVEALVLQAALTSMVVLLGAVSVSSAVAATRASDEVPVQRGPMPPPGRAA